MQEATMHGGVPCGTLWRFFGNFIMQQNNWKLHSINCVKTQLLLLLLLYSVFMLLRSSR